MTTHIEAELRRNTKANNNNKNNRNNAKKDNRDNRDNPKKDNRGNRDNPKHATCDMRHIEEATKEDIVLAYATLAEQGRVECIASSARAKPELRISHGLFFVCTNSVPAPH